MNDVNKDQPSLRILKAYYKISKVIGQGAFGIVYKAFELCSGRLVAIKQIQIDSNNKNLVLKEIEVLKKVEHQNIVKYFNFIKEDNYIFIIMEFLEGGTLKQYIHENGNNITEETAREIIKQIFNALSYLHYSCDVCHRDVKPENIMFSEKDNISSIKLLDFGLSSDSFESKLRMQNCGTLTYMAPEQISGVIYSKAVDIWSVGIILYMLLNKGKNPFYNKGDKSKVIIDKINNKEIQFDLDNNPISPIARHLIYKLLDKNPSYRYTARLALAHPWITGNKFDKIPLTVYDKLLIDENAVIVKNLLLASYFMLYYRKSCLKKKVHNDNSNESYNYNYKMSKSEKNVNSKFRNSFKKLHHSDNQKISKKIINNDSTNVSKNNLEEFNFEDYEKKIIKTNQIYEEKFKEERENMFLPEYKNEDSIKIFLNIERKKLEKENDNIIKKEVNLKLDIDKEINNESSGQAIHNEKSNEHKEHIIINSPQRYESINIKNGNLPHKSILKKSINKTHRIPSPTNHIKQFNENDPEDINSFKELGKTPDINANIKKYGKKLSSKLITFRLNLEPKNNKSKYVNMQNDKNKYQKPIKLQSLKNNNAYIINKINNSNINNNNDIDNPISSKGALINNQKIFETINSKRKPTRSIEKLKKYSSMEKLERNYNGKSLKMSYSIESKKNFEIDNNTEKKNLLYKPDKIRDDLEELNNKITINMLSTKQKIIPKSKMGKSYLTSVKKVKNGRTYSTDNSFIKPKKLFSNNSVLPPIKK